MRQVLPEPDTKAALVGVQEVTRTLQRESVTLLLGDLMGSQGGPFTPPLAQRCLGQGHLERPAGPEAKRQTLQAIRSFSLWPWKWGVGHTDDLETTPSDFFSITKPGESLQVLQSKNELTSLGSPRAFRGGYPSAHRTGSIL